MHLNVITETLFNGEPVELPENGSNMIVFRGPANHSTSKILNSLEVSNVRF